MRVVDPSTMDKEIAGEIVRTNKIGAAVADQLRSMVVDMAGGETTAAMIGLSIAALEILAYTSPDISVMTSLLDHAQKSQRDNIQAAWDGMAPIREKVMIAMANGGGDDEPILVDLDDDEADKLSETARSVVAALYDEGMDDAEVSTVLSAAQLMHLVQRAGSKEMAVRGIELVSEKLKEGIEMMWESSRGKEGVAAQ